MSKEFEIIDIPKPEMTDYAKINFAIEVAFNALLDQANKLGLSVQPVMGLMYLPDLSITQKFQQACREVLECLTPTTKSVV